MGTNIPDISRDTFDSSKKYDKVIVQQGKPIPDSDLNEIQDVLVTDLMRYLQVVEGTILIPRGTDFQYGFEPIPIGGVLDDFTIRGGGAIVEGAVVTTPGLADILYSSLDNYMLKGVVTNVGISSIQDENKMFMDSHYLDGCRLYMTSGTQGGSEYGITARNSNIEIELDSTPTGVVEGDTYIILPPALPSSYPSGRTLYLNLMVFWTELNSDEDPSIINPDLQVETSQRRQRRFCLRADDVSRSLTDPNITFSTRISTVGTITVPAGASELTTDMIELTMSVRDFGFEASNGVVAEPCILEFDLSAGTSITLPTEFATEDPAYGVIPVQYYVGESFNGLTYRWWDYFRLVGGDDGSGTSYTPMSNSPLVGNSGYPINVFSFWLDGVQTWNLDPYIDSHGFLTPGDWSLDFLFSGNSEAFYTGKIHLICYRKKLRALRNKGPVAPEVIESLLFRKVTGDKVVVPPFSGYSDSSLGDASDATVPAGDLTSALHAAFLKLRGRVSKRQSPSTGSTEWVPLWLSHEGDNVDGSQIGIFYRNEKFAIAMNAFIESTGAVTPCNSTEKIRITVWESRVNTMLCLDPSAVTLNVAIPTNWDVYDTIGSTDLSINKYLSEGMLNYYQNWILQTTSRNTYCVRHPWGLGTNLVENFDATDSTFNAFYGALGLTMVNSHPNVEGVTKLFPYTFDVSGLTFTVNSGYLHADCDIPIPGTTYRQTDQDMVAHFSYVINRNTSTNISYAQMCHVGIKDYNSGGIGDQLAIKDIRIPYSLSSLNLRKLVVWISLANEVLYPNEV